MKPTEAAALLAIAAAFDNRKPDADAAQAWAMALDGFRFEDCRDAIMGHYRATSEWLMPSHVIVSVKRLRAKRLTEATMPDPPPDMTPVETLAWLKEVRARIADGEMVETVGYGELTERPAELRTLIERGPSINDDIEETA